MSITHGFQIQRKQFIKELKTNARLYQHKKTGAQLLSLSNDDENKVFGITFRTPPPDSTGVAHILEHSVLCGSRKYPVKEPFVELLKGSLQTFLNAMTYPDRTCYPVASQNIQDFYNLIDVYLDAVFYPRLTPFVFHQEGWHLELQHPEKKIFYKGVVFNEMKGAYSSPDNVLAEYSLRSLFPNNAYGFDSGGDPKHIPSLTFEKFLTFHRRFYHPSNSRVYFYGDDNPEERLRLVDEYLREFDPMEIDSEIGEQPAFDRPKFITRPFMVGDEEKVKAKGLITLNWLLPPTIDVRTNFSLRILGYILLGMPASPLRKALIDSQFGEDMAGEGLGSELRQIYFSTGLKGIDTKNAGQIETLILENLDSLSREGLDPMTIEAAMNTITFHLRENNTGSLPRGLVLMLRSLTTWLYDGDPMAMLAFESPLEAIKTHLKSNSSFFEGMITHFFLENPHRTTLVLEPDPGLRKRDEAAETERLERIRASMAQTELKEIINKTQELKRLQEKPDSPEALATIPVLRLDDLDKRDKPIPISCLQKQAPKILLHDLFTNGIVYLDLGFDLHNLPDKYLPYVSLFGRALVEIGTEKEDFVALTQRIRRKTGGITPQSFTSTIKDTTRPTAWLFLRSKATVSCAHDLMDILRDILLDVRLDNKERFRQMALEEKARAEQRLIQSGHHILNLRLQAHFDEAHWAAEQMEGISNLFFLRELCRAVDEKWPEVLESLKEIHRILINRNSMICNITVDEEGWHSLEPHLRNLINKLPAEVSTENHWTTKAPPLLEGMIIPSQVNYVGKGANIYEQGYQFHGSALVVTRYLRNAWLWDQVRVLGGAYGAFCLFDRFSGALTFVSYRDPNTFETLNAFDQSGQFLNDTELRDEELTKNIIGAIGDMDAHLLPDAKGYASMLRYLTGDTEETRQRMRDQILGTKAADFRAFAQTIQQVGNNAAIKILGSPSALEKVTTRRPHWLEVFRVI